MSPHIQHWSTLTKVDMVDMILSSLKILGRLILDSLILDTLPTSSLIKVYHNLQTSTDLDNGRQGRHDLQYPADIDQDHDQQVQQVQSILDNRSHRPYGTDPFRDSDLYQENRSRHSRSPYSSSPRDYYSWTSDHNRSPNRTRDHHPLSLDPVT